MVTPELGLIDTLLMIGAVLMMVMLDAVKSLAPYPSDTSAVQVTTSPTEAIEGVSVRLLPVPKVLCPEVQVYVGVSDSPSASVTVLAQVNVVLVVTLEDGVMTTLLRTGTWLSRVTLVDAVSVAKDPSMTSASQVMTSVGIANVRVKSSVLPVDA